MLESHNDCSKWIAKHEGLEIESDTAVAQVELACSTVYNLGSIPHGPSHVDREVKGVEESREMIGSRTRRSWELVGCSSSVLDCIKILAFVKQE